VEFGPRGRLDTFSGYAVLQFVMTTRPPWAEFQDLQAHLAERDPPYDRHSGSYNRMCVLWDRMEQLGLVEPAAPDLCALVEAHTRILPVGGREIALPEHLTRQERFDCMVCHRSVLSPLAAKVLAEGKSARQ
jgi:hypothetical protein